MYSRSISVPKSSFFLLGPRGTGKSFWLQEKIQAKRWLDLLQEHLYQDLLVDSKKLENELSDCKPGDWIVIDEVQRLPSLLNEVHRQIERRKLRFALTGSSARKLKRGQANLLGGRAIQLAMHPFVPSELGKDFELKKALRYGLLPLVFASEEPEGTLKAYSEMYLKEEIQAEALVRNLPGFARFLKIAALCHGQTLETTNIARDAGVARTSVQAYLEILKDTLIAKTLPAFEAKLRVKEKKTPKFYLFDPGVVRAIKGYRGEVTEEERGPLLEGLVMEWLTAHNDYEQLFEGISYWASGHSDSKVEVDFVLSQRKEQIAIEVKATTRLRPEHERGLQAITELKTANRRYLLYLGERTFETRSGIRVVNVVDFFMNIKKYI